MFAFIYGLDENILNVIYTAFVHKTSINKSFSHLTLQAKFIYVHTNCLKIPKIYKSFNAQH